MSKLEAIAKLNPKNQRYENGVGGKNTKDAPLDATDIAMALSALDDRIGALLLALKYGGDLAEHARRTRRWRAFLRDEQKRAEQAAKKAEKEGRPVPGVIQHGTPPELWRAGVWQVELTNAMQAKFLPIAREEQWKPGRRDIGGRTVTRDLGSVVKFVCLHAILEYAVPNTCPECKGRKWKFPKHGGKSGTKPCPRCAAAGVLPLSDRARARELGFSEATWRRHWARRYQRMLTFLEWAEAHAKKQFRDVMAREEV